MRGLALAAAAGAAMLAANAAGEQHLRISFTPRMVEVGTRMTLNLHTAPTRAVVHLSATPPLGSLRRIPVHRVSPTLSRAAVTLSRAGRWNFRATQGNEWATLRVSVPRPPTNIFGPLGADGCRPASPRNQVRRGFLHAEVLGTSTSGAFWGLFAFLPAGVSWASETQAQLTGLVGTQMKVVFKFPTAPDAFYAVAPDGVRTPPVWGPDYHESSSWNRPGVEWGAGFAFGEAGCWRIHADAGAKAGDIWVDVLS